MMRTSVYKAITALMVVATLGACSGFGQSDADQSPNFENPNDPKVARENTIWSLFDRKDNDTSVSVNKYLWSASLEVLNFLPIQSIDPYTGVIVTGYGIPPGSNQSYRATVLIDDPALDARSLNIALQTRGGRMVSKATSRAVEDAILSRAREMRIADNKF